MKEDERIVLTRFNHTNSFALEGIIIFVLISIIGLLLILKNEKIVGYVVIGFATFFGLFYFLYSKADYEKRYRKFYYKCLKFNFKTQKKLNNCLRNF